MLGGITSTNSHPSGWDGFRRNTSTSGFNTRNTVGRGAPRWMVLSFSEVSSYGCCTSTPCPQPCGLNRFRYNGWISVTLQRQPLSNLDFKEREGHPSHTYNITTSILIVNIFFFSTYTHANIFSTQSFLARKDCLSLVDYLPQHFYQNL